ncbi:MAG: hypothetical protein ABJH98_07920 [Reichenbachiella sp.]|uniref:hypothetical protein n=1 Tax=Reichenbachiella sp. TaxID=2184521 RepID=UPI003296C88F
MKAYILSVLLGLQTLICFSQDILNTSLGLSKSGQNLIFYYDCNVDPNDKWRFEYSKPLIDDYNPSLNVSYFESGGKDFQFVNSDATDYTLSYFKVAGLTYLSKFGLDFRHNASSIKFYVNDTDDYWYNKAHNSEYNTFVIGKSGSGGHEFEFITDGTDYTSAQLKIGDGVLLDANDVSLFENGIQTDEVTVQPTTIPDYVFEESYVLKPLDEVEDYINNNGHLPEIPSEADIKEEGLKLAEFNMKLLQKIEELTLYTIQLKKEIEELKSEKTSK